MLFNDGFFFKKIKYDEKALEVSVGLDEAGYSPIEVPHDALIDNCDDFYRDYVIWYKKRLGIIPENGKRFIIYFEGVYMDASVYINSAFAGKWVNGYTSFWFDITDFLTSPDDCILVSIDYKNPNSRWYAGPGINRNVHLYTVDSVYLIPYSFYVCPVLQSDNSWKVLLGVEASKDNVPVRFICEELGIDVSTTAGDKTAVTVNNPKLWDVNKAYLYTFKAVLEDEYQGTVTANIGFRDIKFDPDEGFVLNGKRTYIRGVCLHSDFGALGSAYNNDYALAQIKLMKKMGANAIRTAHNPVAPQFLDLCDREGMLVLEEAFDCWKIPKTEYDYARFFDKWWERDIESFVKRDRNHPCIFLWSCGNEILDTHVDSKGAQILADIAGKIREYDYPEHAGVTLCSNYMPWENTQKAVECLEIVGYNYGENLYKEHHYEHPDRVIFGSETASCVQSRNVYHFPLHKSLLADDDMQCSSLGNSTTGWGAKDISFCISTQRDTSFCFGQFLWTGIDYIGEPTPYETKNSYFGMVDTALFPKDAYYLLQAESIPLSERSILHILPYWDFNKSQKIDVRVCSNSNEVELYLNGVSLGRKHIDHKNGLCFYADYCVEYEDGELKAVAYDDEGNVINVCREHSFGETESLVVLNGEFETKAGDDTLRFVEIKAVDAAGFEVKNANSLVQVSIEGPARLIGLDNGDSTDYSSYKGNIKRLFGGKLRAVVKPDGCKGLISVRSKIVEEPQILVRNIKIEAKNGKLFTPLTPIMDFGISLCPSNACKDNVVFKITDESGIPIMNAQVEYVSPDKSIVRIRACADGVFYLRAINTKPDGVSNIISLLELKAKGFGPLVMNPYEFIYGALISDSFGRIGTGNERGISTSKEGDCYLIFDNLDFGEEGCRDVKLSIYEMDNQKVWLTFWNGYPHKKGSEVIGEGEYDRKSVWNVYQDETFTLAKELKGLNTFAIEVHSHLIHLKGFQFIKNPNRM